MPPFPPPFTPSMSSRHSLRSSLHYITLHCRTLPLPSPVQRTCARHSLRSSHAAYCHTTTQHFSATSPSPLIKCAQDIPCDPMPSCANTAHFSAPLLSLPHLFSVCQTIFPPSSTAVQQHTISLHLAPLSHPHPF